MGLEKQAGRPLISSGRFIGEGAPPAIIPALLGHLAYEAIDAVYDLGSLGL